MGFEKREKSRAFGVSDSYYTNFPEPCQLSQYGIFTQYTERIFVQQMNMSFIKAPEFLVFK